MPRHRCPKCGHFRSWELRRGTRRCRACRKEWTPSRFPVPGGRAAAREWRTFLKCFLRYGTAKAFRDHSPRSHTLVPKTCRSAREAIARDVPESFSGTVEVDETYVAGTWYDKRWAQRKAGTKRGRGTGKQPAFGIYERERKLVRTWLKKRTLMPIIKAHVAPGSAIYSDGYQLYAQAARGGYFHDSVDHAAGEYARGGVSTNAMEGFWGMLKRRLRATGGIRRERLRPYVSEDAWRHNNRAIPESGKIRKFSRLLGEFGGKIAAYPLYTNLRYLIVSDTIGYNRIQSDMVLISSGHMVGFASRLWAVIFADSMSYVRFAFQYKQDAWGSGFFAACRPGGFHIIY